MWNTNPLVTGHGYETLFVMHSALSLSSARPLSFDTRCDDRVREASSEKKETEKPQQKKTKISSSFSLTSYSVHVFPSIDIIHYLSTVRSCIMTSTRQIAGRLFHPAQHLWLRIVPLLPSPASEEVTSSRSAKMTTSSDGSCSPMMYAVDMGLTERGLDEVGDLTAIQNMISANKKRISSSSSSSSQQQQHEGDAVAAGDNLLQIDWEGHSITSADELYHTVWETYSGETKIQSPIAGNILEMMVVGDDDDVNDTSDCILDEDTVLVSMKTTLKDLESAQQRNVLVQEQNYERLLKSLSPGRFAES